MEINIQSIHFDADKKLLEFIRHKLEKLRTFNPEMINSEVFLRIDSASDSASKLVEVKAHLPGHTLFASRHAKSFEEAADHCAESIRRQLEKLRS